MVELSIEDLVGDHQVHLIITNKNKKYKELARQTHNQTERSII